MTDSQLHSLGRGWLESKGLMHLLPDPHTHAQIRGCVATYYPGGAGAFERDMKRQFEGLDPVRFGPSPIVIESDIPSPAEPPIPIRPAWWPLRHAKGDQTHQQQLSLAA